MCYHRTLVLIRVWQSLDHVQIILHVFEVRNGNTHFVCLLVCYYYVSVSEIEECKSDRLQRQVDCG